MTDLSKVTLEVKNGIVSLINLSLEQAQEIWNRCVKYEKIIKEDNKIFSMKEIKDYLQYITYCQFYELDPLDDKVFDDYKKHLLLEVVKIHRGDCTKEIFSCQKCQLDDIKEDAQKAFDFIWNKNR